MIKNNSATKVIIFDSSSLINFTMNGLLEEFGELKKRFDGKFIITKEVSAEVIDKPMTIPRFKLEALKIKKLIDEKIIELPSAIGIDDREVTKKTMEVKDKANNMFFGRGNAIQIIHSGEASCLALSILLNEKKIDNVLSVDERTLRMLGEKPENLSIFLGRKLHADIQMHDENLSYFQNFRFIRSTELMYVAYKKGIVKLKNHNVLDAILYALKLNGCSISDEEISEMKRMNNNK
ncbi:MAG: hypothetical protein PHQ66_02415 [Candidatus Nanoarchaeia archaeon]|nr:hypothetical protein [Candidatus Nanoarchaeia archaeon]MDD5357777.1 hypothetical protein [Candidatus Nanoarchaeia archaeon]MDD5588696.1 hypothetical protein [Candidatus Nanoarchaeia archaeon]